MGLDFSERSGCRLALRLAVGCAAALLVVAASGCSRKNPAYLIDESFSLNIAQVNPTWPKDPEELTPAKQEVLETRGHPDYIHLIWNKRQPIMDRTSAWRQIKRPGMKGVNFGQGWIYLEEKEEVQFPSPLKHDAIPLNDKLEVICRLGDPQEVVPHPNNKGQRIEKWRYWTRGVICTFIDDKLVGEDHGSMPPMPGYLGF